MEHLNPDELQQGFAVEYDTHHVLIDIRKAGQGAAGSAIIHVAGQDAVMKGVIDINVNIGDITSPEISARISPYGLGNIEISQVEILRDVVEKVTSITHYVYEYLTAAMKDQGGYDPEMLARVFKHSCVLPEREVSAIILGMIPTRLFPQLFDYPDFADHLREKSAIQGSNSPLNMMLTLIARKHGIIMEGETAQQHYKRVARVLSKADRK